jgi:hypothetical protein
MNKIKSKVQLPHKYKSGNLYFIDTYVSGMKIDFDKESKIICDDYEASYEMNTCNLLPPNQNNIEKLIFEVKGTDENHAFSFGGFLYENGEILGKFKWSVDSKLPDDHFKGVLKRRKVS